jgi:hypothetical protein
MTSSFRIKKMKESGIYTLGSIFDVHLKQWGECHPDFEATPIGRPDGVKLCVRKYESVAPKTVPTTSYSKCSPDLYNPGNLPRQINNPYAYVDRRPPNDDWNIAHDITRLKTELKYDGIGFFPGDYPNMNY